jgi:phage-related protein
MCNIQCNKTDCIFHYMDNECSYGGEAVIITDKGCLTYEPVHDTRCTKCGWEGAEHELINSVDQGFCTSICPNCLTDEHLIDI